MKFQVEKLLMPIKNLRFSANCIVCYLNFPSKIAFPFHPLEGYCRHTRDHFYGRPYFQKWKFWSILIVAANVFTLLPTLTIILTSWNQCDEINTRCVVSINWVCIVVVADMLSKCCSLNFQNRLDELNTLANIFENRKFYGITNMISPSFGETLVKNQKRLILTVCFSIVISAIATDISNDGTWKRYQIVSIYFSIINQTFLLLSIRYKFLILMEVYRSISKHLSRTLASCMKTHNKFLHRTELKRVLHLYLELLKWHGYMNDFLNPSFLIWLASTSLMTVVNTYIAITMIRTRITFEFFYTALGSSMSCVMMDYIMTANEKFTRQAGPTLRYLFKYRISKLDYEEAMKVEMLIMQLILLKPQTKASDMFAIGTRLLPSILGFVITYVLVAIQFRAFWNENNNYK